MIEQDTIRLLRECDAGVKMGVESLEEVLDKVQSEQFRQKLRDCAQQHRDIAAQIRAELHRFCDEGKNPNPIAKSMSWIKTNVKLGMDDSDKTVACLITDGCNMGVKSLSTYLNEYKAAEEKAKDIAKKLIALESQLAVDIREYL